jgi:hypothetical protein
VKEFRYPAGVELSAAICTKALDLAITPFRNIAREHGYALAVHGSLARDIDMVAVPWTERAGDPESLLKDMKGAAIGVFGRARLDPSEPDTWTEKPHGRRAKSIHVYCEGHFFYFDISVMPRLVKEPETSHPIAEKPCKNKRGKA